MKLRRPFKESKQNNKESNEQEKNLSYFQTWDDFWSAENDPCVHTYLNTFPSPISTRNKFWNKSSILFPFQNFYNHFCQPFLSTFCVNFLVWTVYYELTLVVHSTSAIYLLQIYLCRVNCVILHNEQVCTNWMYFSILFSSEENECRSNRSKCEQLCVNTISGYYCECKKGYQLNGKYSCKGRLFGNYYYHLSEQNTAIIRVKRDLDPRRRSPLSALLNVGGGREGGWFNLWFFKDTLCSIQS